MNAVYHWLPTPPHLSYHGTIDEDRHELREWDQDEIDKTGADEIWFWYEEGSYEGDGEALLRWGNKYAYADLGHCSCHGPFDTLPLVEHASEDWDIKASESKAARILPLQIAAGLRKEEP